MQQRSRLEDATLDTGGLIYTDTELVAYRYNERAGGGANREKTVESYAAGHMLSPRIIGPSQQGDAGAWPRENGAVSHSRQHHANATITVSD